MVVIQFSLLLQEEAASKLEEVSQGLVHSFETPCGWFHSWVPRQPVPIHWWSLLKNLFLVSACDHCLLSKSTFPKPVGAGRVQVDLPPSLQHCTHYPGLTCILCVQLPGLGIPRIPLSRNYHGFQGQMVLYGNMCNKVFLLTWVIYLSLI